MTDRRPLRTSLLCGAVALLAYAGSASAQDTAETADASTRPAPSYGEGDIVVTAQKREQRLNDVGLTVTQSAARR